MTNPLVSVILPVYNADQTVEQAITSILYEPCCDFELIIIDNNSTDRTASILHKLAKKDLRIRLLREEKQGISFALNKGLQEANGKYIARMDADDISLPNRLRKQVDFLEQYPSIGLVSGRIQFSSSIYTTNGYEAYINQLNSWESEDEIYRYRFVESPFAHPSVMYRKSLIEAYGFYSTAEIPEDYELWLRWFEQGVRMSKINDYVLRWTDSPNRLTRISKNCLPQAIDQVRYSYLSKWLLSKNITKPIYIWGGGKLSVDKIKLLESTGITISGIIDIKANLDSPIPHIHFSTLPAVGEIFVISMVSNRGKYLEIEKYLMDKGYVFEIDFTLAQ